MMVQGQEAKDTDYSFPVTRLTIVNPKHDDTSSIAIQVIIVKRADTLSLFNSVRNAREPGVRKYALIFSMSNGPDVLFYHFHSYQGKEHHGSILVNPLSKKVTIFDDGYKAFYQ